MKILIIRFSSLGDIVLTEPVIRFLRQKYPDCEIDYLTKPMYRQLISFMGEVNQVITEQPIKDILRRVREKKYDLVIDLHGKLKSILVTTLARSDKKTRYNKQRLMRKRIVAKKEGAVGSTVALYFSAFDKLGITGLYDEKSLNVDCEYYPLLKAGTTSSAEISDDKIEYYKEMLYQAKNESITCIAIFPGALHKTKQYPPDKYADLIKMLPAGRYRFFILGSKPEVSLGEDIKTAFMKDDKNPEDISAGGSEKSANHILNWCGEFNIAELITIMKRFDIIITNDSGPMHIAAALQMNQIAIFGSTSPKLGFKPHNENAVVIENDLSCRPCTLHGREECPLRHFRCMNGVHPRKIAEAIERFDKRVD